MTPIESPYAPAWAMLRIFAGERAGSGGLRVWWGSTDDLGFDELPLPQRIAAHASLVKESWPRIAEEEIDGEGALTLLSILSADCLSYPTGRRAPPQHVKAFAAGLSALGPRTQFYTNVDWSGRLEGDNFGWFPATNARFDAGLIGFNDEVGFLIWVEE